MQERTLPLGDSTKRRFGLVWVSFELVRVSFGLLLGCEDRGLKLPYVLT